VIQLFLTNAVAVDRRLILIREGWPPVRVDYLSPRRDYGNLVASIEASIGSFETLER
jgi:hypothetical protein